MSHGDAVDLVALAEAVLERSPHGARSLAALEWSPRPEPSGGTWWSTTEALFRAQGRTLAVTPALGLLVAEAWVPGGPGDGLHAVAAFGTSRVAGASDSLAVLCPAPAEGVATVLVEDGRGNVGAVAAERLDALDVPAGLDPTTATWRTCRTGDVTGWAPLPPERAALGEERARLAVAWELLGASERLLTMAVDHAAERVQFGRPIGEFQAVQHLLAEARVQVAGLESATGWAGALVSGGGALGATSHHVAVLKALAGRVGRHVAQAALQTFGAAGFTWEHPHHRYERRILSLDALYGGADELVVALGAAVAGGRIPRAPVL